MTGKQTRENSFIWVELSRMEEGPGPYCMSFGFDLDPLILSIKRCGLINPPVVAANEQGEVDIIAGYRRLLALKALGWDRVECRDFTRSLQTPLQRLLFSLHDNLATRPFNVMEKGMILSRLARLAPTEAVLKEYMPLLGLPSHEPLLRTYARLEGLKEAVQRALADGSLSLRTVEALLDLDAEAQKSLSDWLTTIMLNLNQQLQFIEYIKDISIKEGVGISQLLDDPALGEVFRSPEGRGAQKAKHLLEILRRRRFPRLIHFQETFAEKVKKLKLPQGVRVRHDPTFEDPHYHLEISFREGRALREKVIALSGLDGLEELQDPWVKNP